MMRVGLTGGIASGKTTVSRLFVQLGVAVIDSGVHATHPHVVGVAGGIGLAAPQIGVPAPYPMVPTPPRGSCWYTVS